MLNDVKENNQLLKDLSEKLDITKVATISSLNVLANNNKAISYFVKTVDDKHDNDALILRVFGLLQLLFVSIDSLYTLSLSSTRSKNFISINDNKELRELKYIRNDVVGHPTNRLVGDRIEYSILKPEDISNKELSYTIYFENEEIKRKVDLISLIDRFYEESNHFLSSLLDYTHTSNTKELNDDILNAYFVLLNKDSIMLNLKSIRSMYLKGSSSGRILRKINLVIELEKAYYRKPNEELYFVLAYHLKSLYIMVAEAEGTTPRRISLPQTPKSISNVKRVFKSKPYLPELARNLYDTNHPLFNKSLSTINAQFVDNKFINDINNYNKASNKSFIYAYCAILRSFKTDK